MADTPGKFTAPVVDRLSIRVVVDSSYERFLPKATHPFVEIEHVRGIPGRQMTTLAGEWGLSLSLSSRAGDARARYLLDFGYTPEILNRNFDLLDIDPAGLDGLILSHGHRDHFGGLSGFVERFRRHMPTDLGLYVGGEEVFREKWIKAPGGGHASWGALDRTLLTAQNVAPVCCDTPHALAGGFTTGYIARETFETISGGTMVEDFEHFSEQERGGKLVLDEHPDEHGTCYIVRDRGLVVISSCGHVGLINTIRSAMATSGIDRLHAAVGGFHLGTAPQDYIDHVVTELEAFAPDVVIPMHCSGRPFIETMRARMPDQLVTSNVGSRFTFGG
jgi:7,8-dihydropterin-6-yl-methyl-4-(beta-D-ribofuranosyl)aminobenzene 5'-phosphate synthase